MLVTIHQPHLLPWLGYFNKLVHSDAFVILDNVKYRSLYYQNRTFIKDMHGRRHLLTVPVTATDRSLITDVLIATRRWQLPTLRTLEYSYRPAPYFAETWAPLSQALAAPHRYLIDLLMATLTAVLAMLERSSLLVVRASSLSTRPDPTDRLIDLCAAVGADAYLCGEGGTRTHHDLRRLHASGVAIVQQDFARHHPTYPQMRGPFLGSLSIIDALFNVGGRQTRALLEHAWAPPAPQSSRRPHG